eukprot:2473719-Karenia_brevis.AAC.1
MLPSLHNSRSSAYKMVIRSQKMSWRAAVEKQCEQLQEDRVQPRLCGRIELWLNPTHWWTQNLWHGRELGSIMRGGRFWTKP